MTSKSMTLGFGYALHDGERRGGCVPLEGVGQIPEAVIRFWLLHGHDAEPDERLHEQIQAAIREACNELKRRHEARLLRIKLGDYFGRDANADTDDEE